MIKIGEKPTLKVLPEDQTRESFIIRARKMGCEKEMRMIFDKYDKLLRNCKNEKERKDIAKLGNYEVFMLLSGGYGELNVDGETVVKNI